MAESVTFTVEETIMLRDGREILLRAARSADAADLVEIRRQVIEENISIVSDELSSVEEETSKLQNTGAGRYWLVAEAEGRVVGSLEMYHYPPPFLRHHLFLSIELHRDYRGGGLGSAMMRHAADWARHEGYEFIRLGVLDSNPRAQALYERLGYRVYGYLPRFVKRRDGSYSGDTMMLLEL